MNLVPLAQVGHQLQAGAPLPWNVRDEHGKLLLAKNQMVSCSEMAVNLMRRGAFVDADEMRQARTAHSQSASTAMIFGGQWRAMQVTLAGLLKNPRDPQFLEGVGQLAEQISSKVETQTDQLIYSILNQGQDKHGDYGVNHSLHVASVCSILARRANWSEERRASVTGAALTMNLAMIELQGRLAARRDKPNEEQRRQIHDHPMESARILRETGLKDAEWLTAVEQHHEQPGGSGYPAAAAEPGEMSQMLRFADIFTAKHSARADRDPVPAKQAAQAVYLQSKGHPIASLLVKEIGIYPPGCFVKLACGETAVVLRRGVNANAPMVASLTNRKGEPLAAPLIRNTTTPDYTVTTTIPGKAVLVGFSVENLFASTTKMI